MSIPRLLCLGGAALNAMCCLVPCSTGASKQGVCAVPNAVRANTARPCEPGSKRCVPLQTRLKDKVPTAGPAEFATTGSLAC